MVRMEQHVVLPKGIYLYLSALIIVLALLVRALVFLGSKVMQLNDTAEAMYKLELRKEERPRRAVGGGEGDGKAAGRAAGEFPKEM